MKNKTIIYLFVFILSISLITSCKGKDEKSEEEGAPELPSSFTQFQELSDEIITTTMSKDWANSLNNVKEFQSIWTDLYPGLKKQGVSTEDVDTFVKDLNELSDFLISKTLNLPQKPPEPSKEGESQQGDSEQEKEEPESQSEEDGSKEGETKKSTQEEEDKESENSGSSNEQKEESSSEKSSTEKEQDPHKVLNEIDPILSATKEELVIINSAVEVTQHIPKFMTLFKSPVPPDMYKLKFLVRHLDVNSKLDDWDIVSADLTAVSAAWTSLQSSAMEADQDLKMKIDQSIEELKSVIASKNRNLTGFKSTSVIEQIEDLIKKIEDKEKEKKKEEE